MSPLAFLILLFALTGIALLVDGAERRRRARLVRRLAAEWRMNYTPGDSLQVTPRIARHFPIPGAANLQIRDLIYGIERDRYRYVFTAEYTSGIVRTKTRRLRVGTFSEPRSRAQRYASDEFQVSLAPDVGSLVEQYRTLAPAREESTDAPSLGVKGSIIT